MYFVKTPNIVRGFYSKYLWKIKSDKKEIYLTFDDGPTPQITSFVLKTLKQYHAKATFFCVGNNVIKHPDIVNNIINEGHIIGNHTQNHLNGWSNNNVKYIEDVELCQTKISKVKPNLHKLMRPPYGKIKKSQAKELIKRGYKIIMWSVLSGDFDTKITKEQCLKNAIRSTKGDVIVFHDSKKAFLNLEYTLPKFLAYFSEKGFVFKTLPDV